MKAVYERTDGPVVERGVSVLWTDLVGSRSSPYLLFDVKTACRVPHTIAEVSHTSQLAILPVSLSQKASPGPESTLSDNEAQTSPVRVSNAPAHRVSPTYGRSVACRCG